jgi:hypothetical protein
MDRYLDLDAVAKDPDELVPERAATPSELGDSLARLVWESFSDFLVEPATRTLLGDLGIPPVEGVPDERTTEEFLILHLWVHTRAVQLSFFRRAPDAHVRQALDSLHEAVFEDMVANGTPRHQLPVFEQRVSARYSEYYEAAEVSDARVGDVALRHVAADPNPELPGGAQALAERAVEIANPLMDYLDAVRLTEA